MRCSTALAIMAIPAILAASPARADQLKNPDPAIYGEDPPLPPPPPPRSHVPDYISASITAALTATTLFTAYKMFSTADGLDYGQPEAKPTFGDADGWKVATYAFGSAAIISGVVTAFLWTRHRAPAFDVNANGRGAVVTFSGRF